MRLLSTALHGLASFGPSLFALVLLDVDSYGRFALVYLFYAFAASLLLSSLCDGWLLVLRQGHAVGWNTYSAALLMFSVIAGSACALIIYWVLPDTYLGLGSFLALTLSTYRVGLRYFLVAERRLVHAALGDMLSVSAMVMFLLVSELASVDSLYGLIGAWAFGSLAASLAWRRPNVNPIIGVSWFRERRRTLAPLVADSLTMDLAAIGTPLLLLPVLGIGSFGVYRAVSNVAAPIRTLAFAWRPAIVANPTRMVSRWALKRVIVAACASGGLTLAGLRAVGAWEISGILEELSTHAVPVAVYVSSTVLLVVYPLVCRAFERRRLLLYGRVGQTLMGLVFPLGGYVYLSVSGAVWGLAAGASLSGLLWLWLALGRP